MFSSMNKNVATRPSSTESQLPGLHDLGAVAVLLDVDGTILDMAITPSSVVVTDPPECDLASGIIRLCRKRVKEFAESRFAAAPERSS